MDDKKDNFKQNLKLGATLTLISLAIGMIYYIYHPTLTFLVLAIFVLLLGVSIFTRPIKHLKIIQYFDLVFGWIMGLIYLIATIAISLILVFLSIYITWVLLTIGFKCLTWIVGYSDSIRLNWEDDNKAILYCSTLSTAILVSYQGNNLVILLNKLFRLSASNKESVEISQGLALLFIKYVDFRRRCYEISIGLYVFSVIEKLLNNNLLSLPFWLTYKTVALEVLLSFVAIDTYVRNYPLKKKKNVS